METLKLKQKILDNFDKMIEMQKENNELTIKFMEKATEEEKTMFLGSLLLKMKKIEKLKKGE